MFKSTPSVSIAVLVLAYHPVFAETAAAPDDAAIITSAETAAPIAVSGKASIYAVAEDGSMRTVREGTNGWWCMADNPATPGPDPMCGDTNAMEWAMAWIGKTQPPEGKVGFMYMLEGGTDASNTDPYAAEPQEGNHWITTGPHVMIVNAGGLLSGYPEDASPDIAAPYVMWPGTPYAHLMIPVQ